MFTRKLTTRKPLIPSDIKPNTLMFHDSSRRLPVYYGLNQLVSNGNFVNTTGWSEVGSTNSVANNTLTNTGNGVSATPYCFQTHTHISGHKYYGIATFKVTNSACSNVKIRFAGGYGDVNTANPVQNQLYTKSIVFTVTTGGANNDYVSHTYVDAATANGKVMEVKNIMLFDLTAIFGAGNEPSLIEFESILAADNTPYWEGTRQVLCNPDKFWLNQIVQNGNFINTTGWVQIISTISATDNTLSIVGSGAQSYPYAYKDTGVSCVTGKVVYFKARVRVTNTNCQSFNIQVLGSTGGSITVKSQNTPAQNQWYTLSGTSVLTSGFSGNIRVVVQHVYADATTANGKVMEVQNVIAFDLSTNIGASSEPTKIEVDAILKEDGNQYWEGLRQVFCNPVYSLPIKNEVHYTPSTWVEWTIAGIGTTKGSNGIHLVADGGNDYAHIITNLKIDTKYGLLYNVSNTNINGDLYMIANNATLINTNIGKTVGNNKITFMTPNPIVANRLRVALNSGNTDGTYIDFKDIRLFELPTGSQIETDFTNATTQEQIDALATKYPFYNNETLFGTGNVPTKAEMDNIYASDGMTYWDGLRKITNYLFGRNYLYDFTGNGRHMKMNGFAYRGSNGFISNPYSLGTDGVGSYLKYIAPSDFINQDTSFTIGGFFSSAMINKHFYSLSKGTGSYSATLYRDGKKCSFVIRDRVTLGIVSQWYAVDIPDNTIVFVVGVYDQTTRKGKIYVNGIYRGETPVLANGISALDTVSVARHPTSADYTAMKMNQGFTINRALTDTEVMTLFQCGRRRSGI